MGALHAGHLSLITRAAMENRHVIVSIYVNPTQFGVTEDLESYPKTWATDLRLLDELNEKLQTTKTDGSGALGRIEAVFAPGTRDMYPTLPPSSAIDGHGSFVTLTPLSQVLEGASRPVFFRGVATVCMKLFNIVRPDNVYFGQKDVQQTVIIRRMVQDFHLDVDVRIGPTLRDSSGLAMSSRNVYLGAGRRYIVGSILYRALRAAEAQFKAGKTKRADILWAANDVVMTERLRQESLAPDRRALFDLDYISLADPSSMEELQEIDPSRGGILSGAIKMLPLEEVRPDEDSGLGDGAVPVRLIDNIVLESATSA